MSASLLSSSEKVMSQEAQILEPLSKFVEENGNFALLLSYPNGMVKFHSSEKFKSYINMFSGDYSNSEVSPSPSSSSTLVLDQSFDEQYVEPDQGLIPLARALETPSFELRLSSKREVVNHFRTCFRELQQLCCKTVAKSWIKVIEPKKQTNYPYNRGADSKPPWWPSHIRHCEPDHLIKSERIDLMINIVRGENTDIKSLRDATNRIPTIDGYKLKILDEIYLLAKTERDDHENGALVVSDFEKGNIRSQRMKGQLGGCRGRKVNKVEIISESDELPKLKNDEEADTIILDDDRPEEGEVKHKSMAPANLSLVAPYNYRDGFLTTSPKHGTFRDIVNTTPSSIKSNDDFILDRHLPSYNLQFSPNRVDPDIVTHSSNNNHSSPLHPKDQEQVGQYEIDDNIVSEVLKIKDYNIKHSNPKSNVSGTVIKRRRVGKRPEFAKMLGSPLKVNEDDFSSHKVPVFKDEPDKSGE